MKKNINTLYIFLYIFYKRYDNYNIGNLKMFLRLWMEQNTNEKVGSKIIKIKFNYVWCLR